jgi:hypothetical protein
MWNTLSDCSLELLDSGSLVLTPTLSAIGELVGDWQAGSMTETSNRASKRDIRPLGRRRALRLLSVDPMTYQRQDDDDSAPRQVGLVAEEVAAAGLDELVSADADGNLTGIRYSRVCAVLLSIARQQDERISALEAALSRTGDAA